MKRVLLTLLLATGVFAMSGQGLLQKKNVPTLSESSILSDLNSTGSLDVFSSSQAKSFKSINKKFASDFIKLGQKNGDFLSKKEKNKKIDALFNERDNKVSSLFSNWDSKEGPVADFKKSYKKKTKSLKRKFKLGKVIL